MSVAVLATILGGHPGGAIAPPPLVVRALVPGLVANDEPEAVTVYPGLIVVEPEPEEAPPPRERGIDDWLENWPPEVREQAKAVSFCESRWHPDSKAGNQLGLFQLMDEVGSPGEPGYWQGWWRYYGFDSSRYADPDYNSALAYLVYRYDIDRGQPAWRQWTCQP